VYEQYGMQCVHNCIRGFPPGNRDMQMAFASSLLNTGELLVQFVHKLKYLGHIINTKLTDDVGDNDYIMFINILMLFDL